MVMPSSHFAFRVDLADFSGESFHVIAPKRACLSDLVNAMRPKLGRLCEMEDFTADVRLALDGEDLKLEDDRTIQDVICKRSGLHLHLVEPDSSIVAHAISKKEACAACWREAVGKVGKEFDIEESAIQAQLSAREMQQKLQSNASGNDVGFLLVSLLSGDTCQIDLGGEFDSISLQSLLVQVEAEFGIPSGGAELIWNSRRLLREELECTLQDIGLYSGERLTCIQTSDSHLLAFLARLQIDQTHVTSSGHGLGGSTDLRFRFHLADQDNSSTGLAFEAWAAEHVMDGFESCEAQLLWLGAPDSSTCLMQLDCDEESRKYQLFCTHADEWESLAEKLGLASGKAAMQALTCVGLPQNVHQAVLGKGTSYFNCSPTTVDKFLWEPQPKFSKRLPSRQLFVC